MLTGSFTFTARSEPSCKNFLKLKWPGEDFVTLDEFFAMHGVPVHEELSKCTIWYRGREEKYEDYIARSVAFSEDLDLINFNSFRIIVDPQIRAAVYFTDKATDCMQNARFFTMKSSMLLENNQSIPWSYGYIPHFSFRCTYFGTAATWYSNTFDQILQMVYWAYGLYTSVVDRSGKPYNDTWNAKQTMAGCNYDFIVKELKVRGLNTLRSLLTSCFASISEVRSWANYIKHKGGVEYLYLEPEPPFEVYIRPANDSSPNDMSLDDRFAIKHFKSPVKVDIDSEMTVMVNTHKTLYECINRIISEIDFDKYQLH